MFVYCCDLDEDQINLMILQPASPINKKKVLFTSNLKSTIEAIQKLASLLANVSIKLTTVGGHQLSFSSKSYPQFCTTRVRPEDTGPNFSPYPWISNASSGHLHLDLAAS